MSRTVPKVSPMSREAIATQAERLLRRVCPQVFAGEAPIPVMEVLWALPGITGTEFWCEPLGPGVEGEFRATNHIVFDETVLAAAENDEFRARFSVAHEVGHAVLHGRQLQREARLVSLNENLTRLYRRSQLRPFECPEWQANTFAAELLMPLSLVRRALSRGLPLIEAAMLSERFQVSYQAAEIRLKKLRRYNLI